MNDKIVTHEDLPLLSAMRSQVSYEGATTELLDRLIEAAEADKPALPEGWVLDGKGRVYWHESGRLYSRKGSPYPVGDVESAKHDLTPLRPSITEDDFQQALIAWQNFRGEVGGGLALHAAFAAAGVEVQG